MIIKLFMCNLTSCTTGGISVFSFLSRLFRLNEQIRLRFNQSSCLMAQSEFTSCVKPNVTDLFPNLTNMTFHVEHMPERRRTRTLKGRAKMAIFDTLIREQAASSFSLFRQPVQVEAEGTFWR